MSIIRSSGQGSFLRYFLLSKDAAINKSIIGNARSGYLILVRITFNYWQETKPASSSNFEMMRKNFNTSAIQADALLPTGTPNNLILHV
jgi:hypothetical protein